MEEKERKVVYICGDSQIMGSLEVWEYTFGWPCLKGGGDPPTIICFCVPIKVKKEKMLYVCGEFCIFMGSLEVWEHHQMVFPQQNPFIQEPPLQH